MPVACCEFLDAGCSSTSLPLRTAFTVVDVARAKRQRSWLYACRCMLGTRESADKSGGRSAIRGARTIMSGVRRIDGGRQTCRVKARDVSKPAVFRRAYAGRARRCCMVNRLSRRAIAHAMRGRVQTAFHLELTLLAGCGCLVGNGLAARNIHLFECARTAAAGAWGSGDVRPVGMLDDHACMCACPTGVVGHISFSPCRPPSTTLPCSRS